MGVAPTILGEKTLKNFNFNFGITPLLLLLYCKIPFNSSRFLQDQALTWFPRNTLYNNVRLVFQ